jgi:hypothetical protein
MVANRARSPQLQHHASHDTDRDDDTLQGIASGSGFVYIMAVSIGLGRIVALPDCSSTSYQVHRDNRHLFF